MPNSRRSRLTTPVDDDRDVVGPVAEIGEPARIVDDRVELVAVDDQERAAVGGLVDVPVDDLDAAEMRALEGSQELVVIAGDIDDARRPCGPCAAASGPRRCALCGQCQAAPQPPAVDDVADQIDRFGIVVAQEVEQELGLGRLRAEVDIGDEQRAEFAGCVAGHASDHAFLADAAYASIHATAV